MPSSAEIAVVETFGSPWRLNRSSVTSRMRSAVRRGALAGGAMVRRNLASEGAVSIGTAPGGAPSCGTPQHGANRPAVHVRGAGRAYNRGLDAGHFVQERE